MPLGAENPELPAVADEPLVTKDQELPRAPLPLDQRSSTVRSRVPVEARTDGMVAWVSEHPGARIQLLAVAMFLVLLMTSLGEGGSMRWT